MERKCRHVRRVKQYRYKREYRRRGGKVINVERRKISRAVISRLPRYYRYLGDLLEIGVERISSNDLSKKMNVTASQIRQDLNNFGGFGQQSFRDATPTAAGCLVSPPIVYARNNSEKESTVKTLVS